MPARFDSSYAVSQVSPMSGLPLRGLVRVKVSTSPLRNEEFAFRVLTFRVCDELAHGCVLGADYFASVIHECRTCLSFPINSFILNLRGRKDATISDDNARYFSTVPHKFNVTLPLKPTMIAKYFSFLDFPLPFHLTLSVDLSTER